MRISARGASQEGKRAAKAFEQKGMRPASPLGASPWLLPPWGSAASASPRDLPGTVDHSTQEPSSSEDREGEGSWGHGEGDGRGGSKLISKGTRCRTSVASRRSLTAPKRRGAKEAGRICQVHHVKPRGERGVCCSPHSLTEPVNGPSRERGRRGADLTDVGRKIARSPHNPSEICNTSDCHDLFRVASRLHNQRYGRGDAA